MKRDDLHQQLEISTAPVNTKNSNPLKPVRKQARRKDGKPERLFRYLRQLDR